MRISELTERAKVLEEQGFEADSKAKNEPEKKTQLIKLATQKFEQADRLRKQIKTLQEQHAQKHTPKRKKTHGPRYSIEGKTRSWVRASVGDVICVLDADGSHNPSYLPAMVRRLSEVDIVVGSRYVRGGGTQDYLIRMLLSRLFCKVARALLRVKVNDNMSGFMVAKREVFEQLHFQPFGYKFVLELLVKSNHKFTIVEHPVVFEKRKMGVSKTGFGQGVKTFMFILKLWIGEIVLKC